MKDNINIIIPIGGLGSRFKSENYDYPKPLINIMGEPMIFWLLKNLNIDRNDSVYIVYNNSLDHYNFIDTLKHNFDFNIHDISINYQTRGASETALIALNNMSSDEISRPVLLLDCDNIYFEDIITKYKNNENGNVIFYFNTKNDTSTAYSFLKFDDDHLISDIKEKSKISDYASSGAYGFESGAQMKKNIIEIIDSNYKSNNEFYISNIYKHMLDKEYSIFASEILNYNAVGVPFMLQSFCVNNLTKMTPKRICFDLDNTLVSYPTKKGDYSTVKPISKMIGVAKFLKKLGHTIIIHTARRMRTHNNNVEAVKKDIQEITMSTIKKFDIPCDELYFGKPYAHFYVDDLAVNAFSDVEKATGFYDIHPNTRSFNKIISIDDNKIEKISNNIDGERFFYQYVPRQIQDMFPTLISTTDNSIVIEKINGIPLSSMYSNCSLTLNNIDNLFIQISQIHSVPYVDNNEHLACYNYLEKVEERIQNLIEDTKYTNIQKIWDITKNSILEYKQRKLYNYSVIHGDPVFSNILITDIGKLKFIDMRGKIHDTLTLCGDMFYDYAKMYQSIIGYDFILHDKNVNAPYINKMKSYFEEKFQNLYGEEKMQFLKYLTVSLILSLLPLHDDESKRLQYFNLIHTIISVD